MIHYLREKYKAELMEMWKLCFHDTDALIQFYFEEVCRDDEVLVFIENEVPAAALQIIPYEIKLQDQTFKAGYIFGAMTHPYHRRKGLMEQLLHFSFEEMKKKEMQLSFLIPQEKWLFDFYTKYGYQRAFPLCTEDIGLDVHPNCQLSPVLVYDQTRSFSVDDLYERYIFLLSRNENVVLKTKHQFEIILKELLLDNGKFFVSQSAPGIAFTCCRRGKLVIKELLFEDESIKQSMLFSIHNTYNIPVAKINIRNSKSDSWFYGMVKIIDKKILPGFIPENTYMSMMLD